MDFYQVKEREANKKGVTEVYPDYQVDHSTDLMVRGGKFHAVWDEKKGLWSTDELDVARLIDKDIKAYELKELAVEVHRRYLRSFGSNTWQQFRLFCSTLPNTPYELDQKLTFANTEVNKNDYASQRLPYPLASGDISAYDELASVLYSPEERAKFEWAIGAIISGDAKKIHKALVFFGKPGDGKSTIINIFEWLFEGYTTTFEVASIVSGKDAFALEVFKNNPLVGINQDGDLSKIVDNSRLNSIIAHEKMTINEKHKSQYDIIVNAMLVIGTNKPVRITDAKSGMIRRILDVRPTGNRVTARKYDILVSQIKFELGAIAWHCLQVYNKMGKDYYAGYVPVDMMMQTDVFFNYIEAHYDLFQEQNGVSLKQAWDLWKVWMEETNTKWEMPQHKFREELKSYFDGWDERGPVEVARVRNWYSGFNASKYKKPVDADTSDSRVFSLVMEDEVSLFDKMMAKRPAQYSKEDGLPRKFWTNAPKVGVKGEEYIPRADQVVNTVLSDLDTTQEHYVKVPVDHIVIDFDLTDDATGQKSRERNLEAASVWPATYAEYSKSGEGIHLHYKWTGGDPADLSRIYSPGIEVKVYTGDSSLRRRLSRCNNVPVANLSSGIAIKERPVINPDIVATEQSIRKTIAKCLRKEVHAGTKSNMDMIHKVLTDAYRDGIEYDVTDMRPKVMQFALGSTHQQQACLKMMQTMQFKSEDRDTFGVPNMPNEELPVIFDCEVFPNLFILCWKYSGSDEVVTLINPSAQQVEEVTALKLIGFNNRGYDNHIIYAATLGYSLAELYHLSQMIINNSPNAKFREAYNLSYTDIFEFSSKKQTLKQWEIELGIKHLELGLPWDQPVPEELWEKVAEYCRTDVNGTDAVFQHLKADFLARQILAELSGLPINATTQQHAARIIFGEDRKPQGKFKYTDLSEMFDGYTFAYDFTKKAMISRYRGEEVGEGGLVRSKPGMWENVFLLDIESMHPTSIEILDLFGPYTKHFSTIKAARVAIKDKDFDSARQMFGGQLAPFLTDEEIAETLSYALKIVINIVYGLTAASFDNAFRDPRNVDNIVAKIGALFMLDLMHAVEERGFPVVHVKTDSIKIPNASPEIIEFVMEYGRNFGYKFVHEATYSKMCLVNDAVYVAKVGWAQKASKIGTWETVGAQFSHPYVKKTLFTKEPIVFRDKCEAKSVRTALWLDFEGEEVPMVYGGENMQFIGKTGLFTPILPGKGGGLLMREKEGKYSAATGSTGFRWLEAETVKELGKQKDVDTSYFDKLVNKAIDNVSQYGDFEWFVS